MARTISTPHCPFDRLWQPGHPFRGSKHRGRRWTMALALIFMSGVISSYWYLTDPTRIRAMSQLYLSDLVGGNVQVGSASLTVFEGLKLSKVVVKVDNSNAADSALLYADAIEIQYDPASLLRGQLQATRIIATGTKVNLVEDSDQKRWNYQRLRRRILKPTVTSSAEQDFPEVSLRDAQVDYSEMQGKNSIPRGTMAIEGRLFPSANGELYQFELQSRGATEGVGPVVAGHITLTNGEVQATLSNLQFGHDVEAMLPREVRDFWMAHKVEGQLDIPQFKYMPATPAHRATFHVETQLKHVKLIVRSEEFSSPPATVDSAHNSSKLFATINHFRQQTRQFIAWGRFMPQHPPIQVDDVTGGFFFDENGIRFDGVRGSIAGATLAVSAKIDGYSPDAPMWLRLENSPGQVINIPAHPDFLASLPGPVHQGYEMMKPQGTATFWAEIRRTAPTAMPEITGEVNIIDGAFDCVFFPYPVQGAHGKVTIGPDPSHTFVLVQLVDIHGKGLPGGPNENAELQLSGSIAAYKDDSSTTIRARSNAVVSEPALIAACPPQVRQALTIFKGSDRDPLPRFAGSFDCTVFVPRGVHARPNVSIDLNFTDGGGKLVVFPYPLEHLTGQVKVRDGYLDMYDMNLSHGNASLGVTGHVSWPTNLPDDAEIIAKPDLKLIARNVPMDDELLSVLPAEARHWIRTAGAAGLLDVNGHVVPKPDATVAADSVGYDLDVALHDGTARPMNSEFAINDVHGKLTIHPDRLEILQMHGKRGDADLNAAGKVNWSTGHTEVTLDADARQLLLEPALRALLPAQAADAWTTLNPHGVADAILSYHGACPASPGEPLASAGPPIAAAAIALPSPGDFRLTLKPTDVSVTAKPLPYRLDHCVGTITVTPDSIAIADLHAVHGKATVQLSGNGSPARPYDWDLALRAQNLPADDELRKALPEPIKQVLDELKYKGNLSIDLKTLRYRGDNPDPDADLSGTLSAIGGSVAVGVPITQIDGSVTFDAAVRHGKLAALRGDLSMSQLSMADRPIQNLKATLDLPVGSDVLRLSGIRGGLAGGEVAGQMDLRFPDQGNASYLLNFEVKNADLKQLAQQVAPKGHEIRGQVSASLALQGEWANAATRRGRGDVLIAGQQMYQIPLLLGLMEVTNLSLPTNSPFNEGTARYLVEGNRITFEQVQMRSNDMVMSGNGWLDFGSKKVRMNFTTENPNIPKLPVIHDLWEGAKQELLQIQVRGTVQDPQVSASALHTFTTTVDEVLNGNGTEK